MILTNFKVIQSRSPSTNMELVFYAFTAVFFGLNSVSGIIQCDSSQQCILLTSCTELSVLLSPPTAEGIARVQSLTCGFDGFSPKVCCHTQSEVTSSTPPIILFPTIGVAPVTTEVTTDTTLTSEFLPEHCGSIGERVIGGSELPVRSYMWMALLDYGTQSSPDWGCAGSLISERYIVTAAHCADPRSTFGRVITRVRLGEHDISKDRDCQQFNTGEICAPAVQDFSPEQVLFHPNWNKGIEFSDDIALIRLNRKAQLNGYVQPICLPPSDLDIFTFLKERNAEVAGWGRTERGTYSDVKLMVEVPFVDLETCRENNPLPLLDKGQICFGGEIGFDSCSGDSGGPLVSTDIDADSSNLFVLLGVVSYGSKQCGTDLPAVYTEVSQYRNWIVEHLRP